MSQDGIESLGAVVDTCADDVALQKLKDGLYGTVTNPSKPNSTPKSSSPKSSTISSKEEEEKQDEKMIQ